MNRATDARKLKADAADAAAKGKHKKALEKYLELERIEPRDGGWARRAGEMYRQLGRADDGLAAFRRAAEKYQESGLVTQASAICQTILRIRPDDEEARSRLDHLLGAGAKTQGRPGTAPGATREAGAPSAGGRLPTSPGATREAGAPSAGGRLPTSPGESGPVAQRGAPTNAVPPGAAGAGSGGRGDGDAGDSERAHAGGSGVPARVAPEESAPVRTRASPTNSVPPAGARPPPVPSAPDPGRRPATVPPGHAPDPTGHGATEGAPRSGGSPPPLPRAEAAPAAPVSESVESESEEPESDIEELDLDLVEEIEPEGEGGTGRVDELGIPGGAGAGHGEGRAGAEPAAPGREDALELGGGGEPELEIEEGEPAGGGGGGDELELEIEDGEPAGGEGGGDELELEGGAGSLFGSGADFGAGDAFGADAGAAGSPSERSGSTPSAGEAAEPWLSADASAAQAEFDSLELEAEPADDLDAAGFDLEEDTGAAPGAATGGREETGPAVGEAPREGAGGESEPPAPGAAGKLSVDRGEILDEVLSSSPLFVPFEASEARALAENFDLLELAPGDEVARAGALSDRLLILVRGELALEGEGGVSEGEPGSVIGLSSLIAREPETQTARARTTCVALSLPGSTFRELIMTHPMLLAQLSEV